MQEVDNYKVHLQKKLYQPHWFDNAPWSDYQARILQYLDREGKVFIDQLEQQMKAFVMQKMKAIQGAVGV